MSERMVEVQSKDILVVSGFFTGVCDGRHRIFDLHQSYLLAGGSDHVCVYCTGGPLKAEYRRPGIRYLDGPAEGTDAVSTFLVMIATGARLALEVDCPWLVVAAGDIWGSERDWARQLVAHGLGKRRDAELIVIRYARRGYVARLLAIRPALAPVLFESRHGERFRARSEALAPAQYMYETFLRDRVAELGLKRKTARLPGKWADKRDGTAHRTVVPAHPRLYHEHSHDYDSIKDRWYEHRTHPA